MKKLLSFAGVALLALTVGVVGCDDDAVVTPVAPPTPTPPAPIFGTVSGTVSVEGSGLAGVSVNLSGAASQSKPRREVAVVTRSTTSPLGRTVCRLAVLPMK